MFDPTQDSKELSKVSFTISKFLETINFAATSQI